MPLLSLILSYALAQTPSNCLHPSTLDKTADVIEAKARERNGELCASASPNASTEDQTKLLGLLRDRAVERLGRVKPDSFQPKEMREGHARLRAFQALRQSTLVDSPEGVRLSPAVALSSPSGFPKPQNLTPADADMVNRAYKDELQRINAKLAGTTGAQRRRLITEIATPLQTRIRQDGEVGYNQTVATNPALLFAGSAQPTDGELEKAHARYFEEARKAATNLRQMNLAADGDALGLVFFGPAVKETLAANPGMCGAYRTLLDRARHSEKLKLLTNSGLALAAGGACLLSGLFSAGALTSACFALTLGEFGAASVTAAMSHREVEILYGGLMQGASATEYEQKQREAQQYLLAAGLSGAGAVGAFTGVRSGMIAAERDAVIENAHLIGKGEVGRDGNLAGVGNYTKDQIRRKIEELKKTRFISREERKELIRSGRVGVDNPEAVSLAETHLALLKKIERSSLSDGSLALLEKQLKTCINLSIKCRETFKAIEDAFSKEHQTVFTDLERRLSALAEETTDKNRADQVAETIAKLSTCKENPGSPACREAMKEGASFTAPPRLALQGPPPTASTPIKIEAPASNAAAPPIPPRKTLGVKPTTLNTVSSNKKLQAPPNPTRPWESAAIPSSEVDKLTFLTPVNRVRLRSALAETLKDPKTRARRYAFEKKDEKSEFTPVANLNQTLQDLLGPIVYVDAKESKVTLTSHARGITVVMDPTTRYFTVQKNTLSPSGKPQYLTLEPNESGSLRFVPKLPEGADWNTYSHFGY